MKTFALDFTAHAFGAEDFDISIDAVIDQTLDTALQCVHLAGTGRQLELAVAQEVAIDLFFPDHSCHGIDRIVKGVVPTARTFHADLGGQLGIIDGQAIVDMPAVASGGFRRHMRAGFQYGYPGTATCQCQCCRQAGEAAADDGNVHLGRQVIGSRCEYGGGIGPVRIQLHDVARLA